MSAKATAKARARSKSEPRSSSRRRSNSNSGRSHGNSSSSRRRARSTTPTTVPTEVSTGDADVPGRHLLFVGPPNPEIAGVISITGFVQTSCDSLESAVEQLGHESRRWAVVVCALNETAQVCTLMEAAKQVPSAFSIVISAQVTEDCGLRLRCFAAGARMLANDLDAMGRGLQQVNQQFADIGDISCHICGLAGLSENGLHLHVPLYHSMERPAPNPPLCPICSCKPSAFFRCNFYLHLHNEHGPPESREPAFPNFAAFAWVVCRRPSDGRFLLVNEPAGLCLGSPRYWLPAGRVDAGENFIEAGVRETLEEGGVRATVTGVLEFRLGAGIVPRIVLLAEPRDDAQAKSVPDFESCGALWVDVTALDSLYASDFRSLDPKRLYTDVASGTLAAQSIETKSFAALEEMARRLTLESGSESTLVDHWNEEVSTVWEQLLSEYPASCFVAE